MPGNRGEIRALLFMITTHALIYEVNCRSVKKKNFFFRNEIISLQLDYGLQKRACKKRRAFSLSKNTKT